MKDEPPGACGSDMKESFHKYSKSVNDLAGFVLAVPRRLPERAHQHCAQPTRSGLTRDEET
jgi:hypothetical protein